MQGGYREPSPIPVEDKGDEEESEPFHDERLRLWSWANLAKRWGWLLLGIGGARLLFVHPWLGLSVTVVALIGWASSARRATQIRGKNVVCVHGTMRLGPWGWFLKSADGRRFSPWDPQRFQRGGSGKAWVLPGLSAVIEWEPFDDSDAERQALLDGWFGLDLGALERDALRRGEIRGGLRWRLWRARAGWLAVALAALGIALWVPHLFIVVCVGVSAGALVLAWRRHADLSGPITQRTGLVAAQPMLGSVLSGELSALGLRRRVELGSLVRVLFGGSGRALAVEHLQAEVRWARPRRMPTPREVERALDALRRRFH